MMTKKEKKRVPELRFEGFEGEWEVSKLKKIFSRSTKKNTINITEVLTNSASQGIVSQGSYFDRDIANSQNLKNYYVVEIDDFVYNPRISNLAPVGPLKRNKLYRGVMSPLYTVLNPIKGDLNFLEYFFESTCWHKYMRLVANYGARFDRMNITIGDFENLPVKHPSLSEQQKIASFLTSIDTRIHQLEKKKTLLKQYKKGVMQKIFSQEIRFKPDDGEEFPKWEKKRLGEMLDYEQPTKFIVKSTEYHDSFPIPVLTAGKSFILGYTDETKNIYTDFPVIIFDDFTMATKFVDFSFKVKSSAMKILKPCNNNFNIKFLFESIQMIRYPKGDEHKRFWISEYSRIKIELPCLAEQTKIAHFLSALDKKIAVVDEQIEKTKEWKKGLLQRMFV